MPLIGTKLLNYTFLARFKHTNIHFQSTYIVTSTAQTDLGLRYRTFSQKIN